MCVSVSVSVCVCVSLPLGDGDDGVAASVLRLCSTIRFGDGDGLFSSLPLPPLPPRDRSFSVIMASALD